MSSMQPTSPHYRSYELPWAGDPDSRARFRRWLNWLLGFMVVAGIIIPLLPPPQLSAQDVAIPERLARVMIENKPKPPPPPPPQPKVEEKPKETPKPVVPPKAPPKDVAHQKAQKQLNTIKDELADIRQQMDLSSMQQRNLTGAVLADSRAERSLITSKVGAGSGGIGNSPQSRGFGAGQGALGAHTTDAVSSTIGRSSLDGRPATRSGPDSGKAGRSREEIETVFDKNKGAIYALYNRALRENPGLQGKMVLEFTISPAGEVTMCRVISTELNDKDLEEKIISRVRLFRFEPKPVESITTTKPIDFFPA